jgi:hypothetical protein
VAKGLAATGEGHGGGLLAGGAEWKGLRTELEELRK